MHKKDDEIVPWLCSPERETKPRAGTRCRVVMEYPETTAGTPSNGPSGDHQPSAVGGQPSATGAQAVQHQPPEAGDGASAKRALSGASGRRDGQRITTRRKAS